jgi:hypothetical protein
MATSNDDLIDRLREIAHLSAIVLPKDQDERLELGLDPRLCFILGGICALARAALPRDDS